MSNVHENLNYLSEREVTESIARRTSTRATKITLSLVDYRLEQMAEIMTLHPLASRHAVARAAIRAGLDLFVNNQRFALKRLTEEARARGQKKEEGEDIIMW